MKQLILLLSLFSFAAGAQTANSTVATHVAVAYTKMLSNPIGLAWTGALQTIQGIFFVLPSAVVTYRTHKHVANSEKPTAVEALMDSNPRSAVIGFLSLALATAGGSLFCQGLTNLDTAFASWWTAPSDTKPYMLP